MSVTEVHIKSLTEVDKKQSTFTINCFSDTNIDNTTVPSVFKSQILDKEKIIDNIKGKEGELILSYDGDTIGKLNDGDLILDLNNDDVTKYERGGEDNSDLIYNE